MENKKGQIPWKVSCCGGIGANGTSSCERSPTSGEWVCNCPTKPKYTNYSAYMAFAIEIFNRNVYLESGETSWNEFSSYLFEKHQSFRLYKAVSGKTLRDKFRNMCKDVEAKHGLGISSAGYETHAPVTKYDALVMKMLKEMEAKRDQKDAEKLAKETKKNSLLAIESSVLPQVKGKGRNADQCCQSSNDDDDYDGSNEEDEELETDSDKDQREGQNINDVSVRAGSQKTDKSKKNNKNLKRAYVQQDHDLVKAILNSLATSNENESYALENERLKLQNERLGLELQQKQMQVLCEQAKRPPYSLSAQPHFSYNDDWNFIDSDSNYLPSTKMQKTHHQYKYKSTPKQQQSSSSSWKNYDYNEHEKEIDDNDDEETEFDYYE